MKKKIVDTNKSDKISLLARLFLVIFAISFVIIFIGTLFDNKVVLEVATTINNIISLAVAIFLLILITKTVKKIPKPEGVVRILLYSSFFVVLIVLQIIIIKYAKNSPGWDWKIVYQSAIDYVNKKMELSSISYFISFPNNKYLFIIQVIIFKILKYLGVLKYSLTATHIVNIICINISIILTLLTVKKMYGSKNNLYTIFMILLSSAFYIYLPILYSDTISMPIPIALLYIYISMQKEDEKIILNKKNIVLSILFAILVALGFKIKVTTVIVFVSIIISSIICKKIKSNLKILVVILSFTVLVFISLGIVEKRIAFFRETKGDGLPYTHWVMMGLYERPSNVKGKNYIGVYDEKLYAYSFSLGDKKNIIKGNTKRIVKKIKKYGPIDYMKFLYRKCLFAWGDGTYHGSRMLSENQLVQDNTIQKIILCNGKFFKYYYILNTAIIFIMYISLIIGSINDYIKKKDENIVIYMSIFGLLFFLLIWESSARYIVHYVPILIVGAIPGLKVIENMKGKDSNEEKE